MVKQKINSMNAILKILQELRNAVMLNMDRDLKAMFPCHAIDRAKALAIIDIRSVRNFMQFDRIS